jgi:hypothetical protein
MELKRLLIRLRCFCPSNNMYTTLTPDDFRKHLGLDKNYVVDGLLKYGTWDLHAQDKHVPCLKNSLDKLGVKYEIKKFEGENAGHAHEITIKDKH